MVRDIVIYRLSGDNLNGVISKLPVLVRGNEVTAYDLSQMTLDSDKTAVGQLFEAKLPIPSFESNPSPVMNLALKIYEKHAFLTSKGYQADLYDVVGGWCNDVQPFDGGFNCPLTDTQIKNLGRLENLDYHSWRTKTSFTPRISVQLGDSDLEWLGKTWDLRQSEDGIQDVLDRALTSLEMVVSLVGKGYISVYVKKRHPPRTLFEFKNQPDK